MTLDFNIKFKDFELRACPKRLARFSDDEPNETIDLVKWLSDESGRRFCYSLAYFKRDSEGYKLIFVGRRPFEDIPKADVANVWTLLEMAQNVLDEFFEVGEELD